MEGNEFNTEDTVINEAAPVNDENGAEQRAKDKRWIKYAGLILLVGFCAPVVGIVYDNVPKIFIVIAVIALMIPVIKALNDRNKGMAIIRETDPQRTQTCSDIKSLSFDLSGALFVISQGVSFSVNGTDENHFKSYIKNGVWHLESLKRTNKMISSAEAYPVTISLPQGFNAEKASVILRGARLMITGMSAYNAEVTAEASETEIRSIYAKKLRLRSGGGMMKANAKTNGDVSIKCSNGKAEVNLACYPDSLNYKAAVKNGRVAIGGMQADKGVLSVDNRAAHALDVVCENGETIVTFGTGGGQNA